MGSNKLVDVRGAGDFDVHICLVAVDSVEVVAMEQYTSAFVAAWRWFKLRVSVS